MDENKDLPRGEKIKRWLMSPFVRAVMFPRSITQKYRYQPYSPGEFTRYIGELRAYTRRRFGGLDEHPPTFSPGYDLLEKTVRDFQANQLHYWEQSKTLQLLRSGEIVHTFTDDAHILWQLHEIPRLAKFDPIMLRWVTVARPAPEELLILIGTA